jgi:hypothetical protein
MKYVDVLQVQVVQNVNSILMMKISYMSTNIVYH